MKEVFEKLYNWVFKSEKAKANFISIAKEIILLVTGILIAIQINTWHANKKIDRKEVVIIENLLGNLKQAKDQSKKHIKAENSLIEALILALKINPIQNNNYETVLTNTGFYELMWECELGLPVLNTYEDIKSTGQLTYIKNKHIRENFTDLQLNIENLKVLVVDRLTVQQLRVDEIGVNDINFIPLLERHENNLNLTRENLNNYEIILNNPKTRNLLAIKLELTYRTLKHRKSLDKSIDKLMEMLEKELKSKDESIF